jgi:hypothetical protein
MSERLKFIRLPEPAAPEEYEVAAQEIEDRLQRLPGIVAVYRTGSVSVPGISDIDRIAVVERDARVPPVWDSLSGRTRQLAMHGPFLADVETFRRHRWFAHVEPLELVSGTPLELEDPPAPELRNLLIAAESLVVSLLSVIKQTSTGVFKVRPTLCQLNNLRHVLPLTGLEDRGASEASQLVEDVTDARNRWFESSPPQRIGMARDLAGSAPHALREAIVELAGRIHQSGEIPNEKRLGPPWYNVRLRATGDEHDPWVTNVPRGRLPLTGSTRMAELRWRTSHPKISLPPTVLSLLSGGGPHGDFRSTRHELVHQYRQFLDEAGTGYAELGLASPFLFERPTRYWM